MKIPKQKSNRAVIWDLFKNHKDGFDTIEIKFKMIQRAAGVVRHCHLYINIYIYIYMEKKVHSMLSLKLKQLISL